VASLKDAGEREAGVLTNETAFVGRVGNDISVASTGECFGVVERDVEGCILSREP
jgi:hypothetical protein